MPNSKSRRSRAELEEELQHLKLKVHHYRMQGFLFNASKVCGEAFRALRVIGPWICGVFIVQALAGKTTSTSVTGRIESESLKDAIVELVQKESGFVSLCIFLAVGAIAGLVYGRRQSRLRQDDVQRLGECKRLYEERFDARRTSSKITRRGETRPEDA